MLRYIMCVFDATLLVAVLRAGCGVPRGCWDCGKRYRLVLRVDDVARLEVVESRIVFNASGPEVEDEVDSHECEADFEEHTSDFDGCVDDDYDDGEVDEGVDWVCGE